MFCAVPKPYLLILAIEAISMVKTKKNRGWSISPRKNQNRNQFVSLSFGVDPLN